MVREILFYYACTSEPSWQNAAFMDHNNGFEGFPLRRSGLGNCNCHQLFYFFIRPRVEELKLKAV